MLLNSEEKAKIAADVKLLIEEFSETAEHIRPAVSGAGSFSGSFEPSESSLGNISIEFKQLSPDDLKQVGADGVCSLPADSDVREGDILVYQDARYKVTDVKNENCFGVITHLTVKLERIYQS